MAGAKDLAGGNEHKQHHRERIYTHVMPLDHLCCPLLVLEELHQVVIEDFIEKPGLACTTPLGYPIQSESVWGVRDANGEVCTMLPRWRTSRSSQVQPPRWHMSLQWTSCLHSIA